MSLSISIWYRIVATSSINNFLSCSWATVDLSCASFVWTKFSSTAKAALVHLIFEAGRVFFEISRTLLRYSIHVFVFATLFLNVNHVPNKSLQAILRLFSRAALRTAVFLLPLIALPLLSDPQP